MADEASTYDGIAKQNVVFMSGILITPVIAGATNFEKAAVIAIAFSLISFYTIMVCRLISRKIVYTVRITLYALMAAIVYIPICFILNSAFGTSVVESVGVYLPILAANPLILTKTESRFYLRSAKSMVGDVFSFVIGFDIACMLVGTLRDIFANGAIGFYQIDVFFEIPSMETPFCGFILVGVIAGIWRAVFNATRNKTPAKIEPKPTPVAEKAAAAKQEVGSKISEK